MGVNTSKYKVDLSGEWKLRLDPERVGIDENWYDEEFADNTRLPGTLSESGYGEGGKERGFGGPYVVRRYSGRAWYQKDVVIQDAWAGKRVTLFLERASRGTGVWLDGKFVGMRLSQVTPHVYDITNYISPGSNRLAVMVDNSKTLEGFTELPGANLRPPLAIGTRHCEEDYNGIVGRIELNATDPVWIQRVDVYPNIEAKSIRIRTHIGNTTGRKWRGELVHHVVLDDLKIVTLRAPIPDSQHREQTVECEIALGDSVELWSEFNPAVYRLSTELTASSSSETLSDTRTITFGMRELSTDGRRLLVNGEQAFMRGRVDSGVWMEKGYAPMDLDGWMKILETAQSYGLNHFRFHSWCPSEAGFEAADRLGFMFQVEPSDAWSDRYSQDSSESVSFHLEECLRICEAYGNHPSFFFLSVGGNEQLCLGHPYERLMAWRKKMLMERLDRVRKYDSRHLYTCTTQPYGEGRNDDYFVSAWGKGHSWENKVWSQIYGCKWGGPDMLQNSRFIDGPPTTDFDFSNELEGIKAPVISHEVGQWAVFPDVSVAAKYEGPFRPGHLELLRKLLEEKGMLEQANDFVRATGQFALRLYKEEIESALRTPDFTGFQILDLIDYPWQNTATVGILDEFWGSKDITTPEAFREFCGPVVPLLRMPKMVWLDSETFSGELEIANYSTSDYENALPEWTLSDWSGNVVKHGSLAVNTIARGCVNHLGNIEIPLGSLESPGKYVLRVSLKGTEIANSWESWVYPDVPVTPVPEDISIFTEWGEEAKAVLEKGGKELLIAGEGQLKDSIPGIFIPVYWSWLYFIPRQVGTMGLLCDPAHPALRDFPTDFHSNWQWWDLIQHSRTMVLEDMPKGLKPVVQVIDKYDTCRKLGSLFEARVGDGKLMVCSMDIGTDLENRSTARQMRQSLLDYMAGDDFEPAVDLSIDELAGLFIS